MERQGDIDSNPNIARQEERLREVVSELGGLAAEAELSERLGEYDEATQERLGEFVLSINEQLHALRAAIGIDPVENHGNLQDYTVHQNGSGNGSREAAGTPTAAIEEAVTMHETDQDEKDVEDAAAEEPYTQEQEAETTALEEIYDLSNFTDREIVVIEHLIAHKGQKFAPRELLQLIDAPSQTARRSALSALMKELRRHPEFAPLLREEGAKRSKRYWFSGEDEPEEHADDPDFLGKVQ